MQPESLIGWYYTFLHSAPCTGIVFYVFRRNFRFGSWYTILGYLGIFSLEGVVQMLLPGVYDQRVSLLFQLFYFAYALRTVHDHSAKVLATALLTLPLALLSFTAAAIARAHWPLSLPGLVESLTITLWWFLFTGPVLYYIHHVLRPLLAVQEKKPWQYLACYEMMLLLIALLIDPYQESASFRVFLSRVLLLTATVACVQIMAYLCQSIQSREYTQYLLNSIQALQNMERQRYETVMIRWRASRQLRHDFRHYMVSIATLARARNGTELKAYLQRLLERSGLPF